ncbi:MAG: ATP-binding protein [Candidatus Gracilibacteria bacterium]
MKTAYTMFERLISDGKKETDRLIATLESESLYMDYKGKSYKDEDDLSKDDMLNLDKALSGYANTEGGVLIWGIEKKDGVLGSYVLIEQPEAFVERLNTVTPGRVSPSVDGVRHEVVFSGTDGGVVVTYVPQSESTPHRSVGKSGQYYKRHGGNFLYMEHFEIEDMFGRRARPKLGMDVSIRKVVDSRPDPTYALTVNIFNDGKAISQLYGFDLEFIDKLVAGVPVVTNRPGMRNGAHVVDGICTLKYRNGRHDEDSRPIYPGETIVITPNNHKLGHIQFKMSDTQFDAWKDFELGYKVYSENMLPQGGTVRFGNLFLGSDE